MPHSEIHGSKGARPSPRLFAACHVLHRLSVPRHPPNALTRLIRCASAAHREQTPRMRASTPRLILSTSFYPPGRQTADPSASSSSPQRSSRPKARQSATTASRIPIHNVNDQRTEVGGRRTDVLGLATSPNCFLPSDAEQTAQNGSICPPSSVLRPPTGGADRDRTGDALLAKQVLSQLSYGPVSRAAWLAEP